MPPIRTFKFTPWLPLIIIGVSLGYAVTVVTRLPWWTLFITAGVWIALGHYKRWGKPRNARYRAVWPWSLVPLILIGIYVYLADSFGIVDLGAVFFHLQAGIAEHGGAGKMILAVVYILVMLMVLGSVIWMCRHDQRWRLAERFIALALLAAR